jgi:hypothetical protein
MRDRKCILEKRKCGLRSIVLPDIIIIVNFVTLQEPTVYFSERDKTSGML